MAKTGAIRAGRAFVELFADDSALVRGLRRAGYKLKAFGRSVSQLGRSMLRATTAILVPVGLGVREFARFEEQLARVSTMVDDTAAHMGRFRKALSGMAVEFGVSTETLAGGLYDILSAQIPASKALDVLREGTKGAIGGFTDTKTSTSALITILNAYGDQLRDAADASDLLFSIVKRGRLTYEDLASNLGKVAPSAAAAGVSVEEFGAVLALITRGMPDTDNATTALANVIETFMKNTDDAKAAARKLGINMSTAGLRSKGLLYVIQQLAKVDPDTVAKVFPRRRALRGLIIAVQKAEELGIDIETMINRAGAAEEAYQKMAQTPLRALAQLWEGIKKVGREVGAPLIEPVMALAKNLGKLTADIGKWIKQNGEAVKSVAALAGVLLGGGGLLIAIGGLITALGALISPLSLVLTAVTALAGGIAILALKKKMTEAEAGKLTERYKELATKVKRTADEELELLDVSDKLKRLFPELAKEIDGTAESVKKLGDEFFEAGKAATILELRRLESETERLSKAIVRQKKRIADSKKVLERARRDEARWGRGETPFLKSLEKAYLEEIAEYDRLKRELKESFARIFELEGIGTVKGPEEIGAPGAAPGEEAEEAEALAEKRAGFTEQLDREIHQLRLQAIEDEYSREITATKHKWAEERRRLKEAGATREQIAKAELAERLELENIVNRERKRRQQEMRRELDEQARRREELEENIARERIKLTKKGLARDLALLELELKKTLREAEELGLDPAKLRKWFALRAEVMRVTAAPAIAAARISVAGTFGARALAGLGMGRNPVERTARATEEMARIGRKLLDRANSEEGLVFQGI